VLDLTTMRVIGTHGVGDTPDVLAWDAAWRRLYVASEGGLLSAFWADGTTLRTAGEYRAPHAHMIGRSMIIGVSLSDGSLPDYVGIDLS
jgi:hypothetical protein